MAEFIDRLALMHFQDKKLLCVRSHGKDAFYNPGGKRENNETDIQALVREIKEELNIDIIPDTAKLYGVFVAPAHGKPIGTMIRMTCYFAEFNGIPKASNEIAEVRYLGMSDINMIPPAGVMVFNDAKEKGLLE